jgi:hypothetical protein
VSELDVGVAVDESSVAVDSVVLESSVAVDVESDVAVEVDFGVVAAVAAFATAVACSECADAPAANPPISTVAPTATDPVATVSVLIRRRLRSRLSGVGSPLLMQAFEQPFLNAS